MVAIDMEMPSCCANCELCINGQYEELMCALLVEEWEETDYNSDHRDEKCPLVEIEERKVGKWIKATKPSGLVGFECSNCGAFYPFIDKLNYCPSCGTEMRGAEE